MNHSVKLAALAASLLWISCSPAPGPAPETPRILPAGAMNDPLEPLNRGLWVANRGLLAGILQPAGRVWRTLVPTPARESIQNFNRNVRYPGRVANQMLQGRWQDAGDESLRFLANTTAGVGGLFDVASKWDMPKSNADFGQTFTRWGWRPGTYLMLPVFGPSDECHALGTAADRFADPLNYSEPYSYISAGTSFNRLSESTDEVLRLIRSSADPYADTRILWTHAVAPGTPDMRLRGPVDMPTLQTLGISLIRCKDRDFPLRGREMSVRVPATGRTAPFNVWLQKQPAPLVYINPGLGGHRLSLTQLSLAEFLYQNGFSVVVTSSVFHPEFMERAATTGLPAYPPADSADLLALLAAIDARLERRHPGLLGPRALVGFSMGGFHALNLAAREKNHPAGSPRFERYVAINPPVDLHRGISALDRFVNAPAAWPENEREARIDNTFLKVAHFARQQPSELAAPPLEAAESKLLIGLSFRMILRDTIFSSQARHNMGVLQNPLSKWRRDPVYQEILGYSYEDYFHRFVLPYYHSRGIGIGDFKREADLHNFTASLAPQDKARVITNRNDFLLEAHDFAWLESTFRSKRLHLFPSGGHLGNLGDDAMHAALLEALGGLNGSSAEGPGNPAARSMSDRRKLHERPLDAARYR
ncbi:MAG: alpha/beta fold hydrolase [Verrucomicrobiaceae bacterium]|nr:MAG: alpha/beta fold hydrolase [Verrucomicrobiaceae bacterium]